MECGRILSYLLYGLVASLLSPSSNIEAWPYVYTFVNSKMKPLFAGRYETEQFKNSYNIVDAYILGRIAYVSFNSLNNICTGDEVPNNGTVIRDEKFKRIQMKGSEITIIWTIEEIVVAILL